MTITAKFKHYDPANSEADLHGHSGERVTVLGEVDLDHDEFTVSRVRFPDGEVHDAFNDELSEWRLEK
jgi:hypothetical protein